MTLWQAFARVVGLPIVVLYEGGEHRGILRRVRLNRDGSLHLSFADRSSVDVPARERA